MSKISRQTDTVEQPAPEPVPMISPKITVVEDEEPLGFCFATISNPKATRSRLFRGR